MRLRIRLLLIFLKSFFIKKKTNIFDETLLTFRALPHDVDIRYLTNDRYLSFMDLGRTFLILSFSSLSLLAKKKWIPVATNILIHFRYPVKLFQKFNLRTSVVWWDNRHVYISQKFEINNRVLASAVVSATYMNKKGIVPTDEIFSAMNFNVSPGEKPSFIEEFQNNHPPHRL